MSEVKKHDWDTPEKHKLIKEVAAKNCTQPEMEMLLYIARTYSLNPLLKEVFAQKYKKKDGTYSPASYIVTRDGFVNIAHQTGEFEAMQTKVEEVQSRIERNGVKRDFQYKGVCTIWRKGASQPFIFEAYEDEYNTNTNVWADKPRTMIMKVAESQALRKAFKIHGLYTEDEMPPANEDKTPTPLTDIEKAQAEFEAKNGIKSEPKPEAKKAVDPKLARINKAPAEVIAHFKARKMNVGQIIAVLDANQDDPESLKAWVAENPVETSPMVKEGEEGMPE